MSASVLPPTAPTTLVMLLGASACPNSPGFQASRAFVHAAQGFRDYLLDPHGFGLPAANLLDQFDVQTSSSEQLELLGSFLEERTQALKTANQAARDVLVYFVGHGSFAGSSYDFYLLLRRTNTSALRASGMAIEALAEVLREKARQMRRYLLLDCCFAAAAFRAFQGGPDQTAITKTLDAFAVQARSSGFPRRGTVLLCSSDQKTPSQLLPDESCTMFSHALLDVLKNGDLYRPPSSHCAISKSWQRIAWLRCQRKMLLVLVCTPLIRARGTWLTSPFSRILVLPSKSTFRQKKKNGHVGLRRNGCTKRKKKWRASLLRNGTNGTKRKRNGHARPRKQDVGWLKK